MQRLCCRKQEFPDALHQLRLTSNSTVPSSSSLPTLISPLGVLPLLVSFLVSVSCQLKWAVRAPSAPERCIGQVSNLIAFEILRTIASFFKIDILWGRMSWDARSNTRSLSHTALIISTMFPFKKRSEACNALTLKYAASYHWNVL